MPNLSHVMPKPVVIPILWGHDYVVNASTPPNVLRMISDLVTGPFMNGMAQYGVRRGSVRTPIVIDDQNPPKTIVYTDSNDKLQDDITQRLIKWINAGLVPPPPSPADTNQLYMIIPPIESTLEMYNGKSDPTGQGVQGFHNEGVTNPSSPPTYYWAIVKTDWARPNPAQDITPGISPTSCHELAEQFVDRNGSYIEVGDACVNNQFVYRGWTVQQYTSVWDGNICIRGNNPVSVARFLKAIGEPKNKGLLSLGTPTINIDYIALKMQSYDT
jgi:hypothetical protein